MDSDWKDALSSLRDTFDEPKDDNNPNENLEEEKTNQISQTQRLNVIKDKKGRNGKIATIIEGFELPQVEVEEIARKMKKKLGVGGSVRNGEILIQGDHSEKVIKFLSEMNFKIKGLKNA